MKRNHFYLLTVLLTAYSLNVASQPKSITSMADRLRLTSKTKLAWYSNALKLSAAKKGPGTSGSTVLNTRNLGANRVEIGIGLTGSAQGFSANGSPRQQQSGSATCTIQPTKIDFSTSDNFNLFTGSNTIMPGQFFTINSIINNSFSALSTPPRKPYQLGISIFNAANPGPNFLDVTNLSRSPLPEIQATLLAPNYGAFIPAEGILDMVKINSSFELKARFETSQGIFLPLEEFGIPADITAGIEGDASSSNNVRLSYYMVNFIQPMYTINVLTNNNQLFQTANAHAAITDGAYVESVTYGRRLTIIIGSSSTETKIRAALSAALSASITGTEAAGVELGSEVSGETEATLRNVATKFHAKIYGGEGSFANRIFADIVAFKTALKNYISSPSAGVFSANTTALPLNYTLRRISDNSLLSVRSVGSFDDLVSCNTSKYNVEILWNGFTVNKVIEGPGDDKEDIYGTFHLKSVTTNGRERSRDVLIKSIPKNDAISKKAGESDDDDVIVSVLTDVSQDDLLATILNFSQGIFDWELVTAPAYKENNSSDLKFSLSDVRSDINALAPGAFKTFNKNIGLTESSVFGESKITLRVKVRVTRN